jgi:hypothetical protein
MALSLLEHIEWSLEALVEVHQAGVHLRLRGLWMSVLRGGMMYLHLPWKVESMGGLLVAPQHTLPNFRFTNKVARITIGCVDDESN